MNLTDKQIEIVKRLASGEPVKEIGARTTADLIRFAVRTGIITLCLTVVAMVVRAQVQPPTTTAVTLTWTASPDSTVTNYGVFWGVASQTYTNHINTGTNLTGTVSNLLRGQMYYFAINCTSSNGPTSGYSAEVSGMSWPTPGAPGNAHLTFTP